MSNKNRKNIKKACENCQKLKRKCSDVRPCMNCVNRKIECVDKENKFRKNVKPPPRSDDLKIDIKESLKIDNKSNNELIADGDLNKNKEKLSLIVEDINRNASIVENIEEKLKETMSDKNKNINIDSNNNNISENTTTENPYLYQHYQDKEINEDSILSEGINFPLLPMNAYDFEGDKLPQKDKIINYNIENSHNNDHPFDFNKYLNQLNINININNNNNNTNLNIRNENKKNNIVSYSNNEDIEESTEISSEENMNLEEEYQLIDKDSLNNNNVNTINKYITKKGEINQLLLEKERLKREIERIKKKAGKYEETYMLEKYKNMLQKFIPSIFLPYVGMKSGTMFNVLAFPKNISLKSYNPNFMKMVDVSVNSSLVIGLRPQDLINKYVSEYMAPFTQTQAENYSKTFLEMCTQKINYLRQVGFAKHRGVTLMNETFWAVFNDENNLPSLCFVFVKQFGILYDPKGDEFTQLEKLNY
eukprot:TRINITY_DN2310_c2_g1_i2.p1 TRINITY_DN2310_c2_g1~~TRINITY_DN2310_c2_g1_i2.p1  ORF type:complete len:477 (-),score=122.60 TRINITY_DN2310_c2_g1_i2:328-1758(-)